MGGSTIAGTAFLAAGSAFSPRLNAGDLPNGTAGENSASVSSQPTAGPQGDQTTSDIIVEAVIAWGATHVFGLVGDGIAGLIEAERKREGQIQYIGVRHEEAAAFMASGYAKLTGKLGVCIGTTGPGAVHLLNDLGFPFPKTGDHRGDC
jgi:pyruvate dehydrogenase (quinone)